MLHHQRAVGVLRAVEGAHAVGVCEHREESAGEGWRDRLIGWASWFGSGVLLLYIPERLLVLSIVEILHRI